MSKTERGEGQDEMDRARKEHVVGLLKEALLDMNVYDRMDKLYNKFLKLGPAPPPLAVLLSIL